MQKILYICIRMKNKLVHVLIRYPWMKVFMTKTEANFEIHYFSDTDYSLYADSANFFTSC